MGGLIPPPPLTDREMRGQQAHGIWDEPHGLAGDAGEEHKQGDGEGRTEPLPLGVGVCSCLPSRCAPLPHTCFFTALSLRHQRDIFDKLIAEEQDQLLKPTEHT